MSEIEKGHYTSGEVSRKLGISKNTLFKWEREGRIPPAKRDWRNYRYYTLAHIRAISLEMQLRRLGDQLDRCLSEGKDRSELLASWQRNSVLKFAEQGDELGLSELRHYDELAPETVRALLLEAQARDPGSHGFRRIVELVDLKTRPLEKSSAG